MENFKDILQDLIDEKGLSLRQLEKKTAVPSSQFSRYLKGVYPSIDVAERLAEFFGCSFDFLFGLDDVRKRFEYKHYDMSVFLDRYGDVLKENNITHWKLCKEIGLNESNIRKWQKGVVPKIQKLIIITKELSTSIDFLIGRV